MVQKKFNSILKSLWESSLTDKGITFIESAEKEEFIPYSQLQRNAYQICNFLKNKNIDQNSEIVFQFSNLKALIYTFWACLMGNYVPIPIATINNEYTSIKLINIWKKLNNPHLIFDNDDVIAKFKKIISESESEVLDDLELREINYNAIQFDTNKINEYINYVIDINQNDSISYIQFSSGSTGNPKGVIINNSNIITNVYDVPSYTINTRG
jgi:long-subunit acyl-CoA synthetase (AMP-forming)